MNTPLTYIGSCHNIYIRQMHFINKGDNEIQHTHAFDHITLLSKGSLDVECNGEHTTFHAPHMIYIKANYIHAMTALEDDTLAYCINSVETSSKKNIDDIITPEMVPNGSIYDL